MNQRRRMNINEGVLMLFCLAMAAVVIIYGVKAFSKPIEQEETLDPDTVTVYTGVSDTESPFGGDIILEVAIDGSGRIVHIQVGENNATEGIGTHAIDDLIPKILEEQTLELDNVTLATITSEAIKAAVADALAQAGIQ